LGFLHVGKHHAAKTWGVQADTVHTNGSTPVGLGNEVPWSWSNLRTLFTRFDYKNDQNLKTSHTLPHDFWTLCFTVTAKRHACGLRLPNPRPTQPLFAHIIAQNSFSLLFQWKVARRELNVN